MSLQRIPWMVNGGTGEGQQVEHSAALARQQNFAALGGQTGIVGPGSLEVVAGDTPGGFVNVMPGSGTITYAQGRGNAQDRAYASAKDQLVPVRNDALAQVEIAPTSSAGGRTDMVCIEVNDPELEGTSGTVDYATHEFVRFRVVQNVSTTARFPWQLSTLSRPLLPLARVHIPASTATITGDMLQDIRRVAKASSEAVKLLTPANAGEGGSIEIPEDTEGWQDIVTFSDVLVPSFATRAKVSMTLTHAYGAGGRVGGLFRVWLRGQVGNGLPTSASNFIDGTSGERFTMHCAGDIPLHRNTAAASCQLTLQIRRSGTNRPGRVVIPDQAGHTAMADGWVVFEEGPRYDVEGT